MSKYHFIYNNLFTTDKIICNKLFGFVDVIGNKFCQLL